MNLRHIQLIWSVLILSGVVSCKTRSVTPVTPDVGVSTQEMNTRFVIRTPREINSFQINDRLYIEIKAISGGAEKDVAFQSDFGVRMFAEKENQWIEIKNDVQYREGEGSLILSPAGGNLKPYLQIYKPVLQDVGKTTTVRIFLVGNIMENGKVTDITTGAYIDVELKP